MLLSSSSTFNFKKVSRVGGEMAARRRGRIVRVLLWTVAALVLLDVVVGFTFRMPADPRRSSSSLQAYFDYGRSIEGKLRRMVGVSPDRDASIVGAGWLANECDISSTTAPDKVGFDVYGMSFSDQIADRMVKLDHEMFVHHFSGPAAPPNHSYACFARRVAANRKRASIQILGVLASSLRRMETITGLTTSFEGPQPFTYPRYFLTSDGDLRSHSPSITTEYDLREALGSSTRWRAFVDELTTNDAFYARHIFQADVFDHSVVGRMIRRAWGQRVMRDRTAAMRASDGFSAPVLQALLLDFVNKSRAAAELPIIILIEDRGYGGAFLSIATELHANDIPFLTTSMIISPDDSANFLSDGHFTPAANDKIARAVLDLLARPR
jgi:hypothetical protein